MNDPVWISRACPRCGAVPGKGCRTPSGKRAGLPHRERFPEGPPRTKTAEQLRRARESREVVPARQRSPYRHLPKDDALRALVRDRMREFRERQTVA